MFNLKCTHKRHNYNTAVFVIGVLGLLLFSSCKDEVLPKPASYLRLDYPVAEYANFENKCPFTFEMNSKAIIKGEKDCSFTISYPKMKATIYLTYKRYFRSSI